MARKKEYLLRTDARLFEEIQAWAAEEFRSVNGQIEFLLSQAVLQRRGKQRLQEEPGEGGSPEEPQHND